MRSETRNIYSGQHIKLSAALFHRGMFKTVGEGNKKRVDGKKDYPNYYSNQQLRRDGVVGRIRNGVAV